MSMCSNCPTNGVTHDDLTLQVVGHIGFANYMGAVDRHGKVHDVRLLLNAPRFPRETRTPEPVEEVAWDAHWTRCPKRGRIRGQPVKTSRDWVVDQVLHVYRDVDDFWLCVVRWTDFPRVTTELLHMIEECAPKEVEAYWRDHNLEMVDVD